MRYNKEDIPSNVTELYSSGWADFIRLKIRRYNLRDINNSVEDILQDMMAQMLANNFIESYDASGRPFEVYLSVFIFNFMSKRYKKEYHSRNGQNIILSKSIEADQPNDAKEYNDSSTVYLEHLEDAQARFDNYFILVESLRTELKKFKANSSVTYNGKIYQRDPSTLLELLIEGKSIVEIAEIFDTSKQFVYLLLNKIRGCETLEEYT